MTRVVPKLSASLIILDKSGPEVRFLMGRRHANHVFMPNRYVFPGGRVDRTDTKISALLGMQESDEQLINQHLNVQQRRQGAKAIALCAVREAFEESGHMIGRPTFGDHCQDQLRAFAQQNMAPNLSALRVLARAVTPAPYPRRYDAWFFLAFRESIAFSVDVCGPESELDHQIWVSEGQAQAIDLPSITRMVLSEALQRLKNDPDMTRNLPVPMFFTQGKKTLRRVLTV